MFRFALLLAVITFISGATPIATKFATRELPPLTLAFFRFGTAAVLLGLTCWVFRRRFALQGSDWKPLLFLGAVCVPVNQAGYLFGVRMSNASHGGIAYALTPVLTYWISRWLDREPSSGKMLGATLLAFAGAAIAASATAGASIGRIDARVLGGDALLFLAVASWSLFVVVSQPIVERLGSLQTLTLVFAIGAVLQLPLVAFDALHSDLRTFSFRAVTVNAWLGFGFITLITAFVNYVLWYVVTSRFEVTRATVVTNLSFVVAILLEAILFGGRVGWSALVGSCVLFGGILLASRARKAAH